WHAGAVSLPVAHAHRRDRGWRELPDEPGHVRAAAGLRPGGDAAVWHRRSARGSDERFHLYLALLQPRLPDVDARAAAADYRQRADGAHEPAAGAGGRC